MASLIDFRGLAAAGRSSRAGRRQKSPLEEGFELGFRSAPQFLSLAQRKREFEEQQRAKEEEEAALKSGLQDARELAGFTQEERDFVLGPEGQLGFEDGNAEVFPLNQSVVSEDPQEKAESLSTVSRLADPLIEVGTREGIPALIELGAQFKTIQQAEDRISLDRAAQRQQSLKVMFAMLPEGNTPAQNLELVNKFNLADFLGFSKQSLDSVDEMEALMALQNQFNRTNTKVTASFRGLKDGQSGIYTIMSDGTRSFIPAEESAAFGENPEAFVEREQDTIALGGIDIQEQSKMDLDKEEDRQRIADAYSRGLQQKNLSGDAQLINNLLQDERFQNTFSSVAGERAEEEAEEETTVVDSGRVIFRGFSITEPGAQQVVKDLQNGELKTLPPNELISELDKRMNNASTPKEAAQINFIKAQILLERTEQ